MWIMLPISMNMKEIFHYYLLIIMESMAQSQQRILTPHHWRTNPINPFITKQILIGFLVKSENIKHKHNMLGYERFRPTTKSSYFVIYQLHFSFSYSFCFLLWITASWRVLIWMELYLMSLEIFLICKYCKWHVSLHWEVNWPNLPWCFIRFFQLMKQIS